MTQGGKISGVQVKTLPTVNERAQRLLKVLIENFLVDGTPVGSKTIAENAAIKISSATVRNVMADLEEKGLVVSPHTSAGKIPTEQGLRFFVDSLISIEPPDRIAEVQLQESLYQDASPTELIQSASKVLADISSLVGLVTTPRPERIALRQIQFLRLSKNKVLAIIVVNEQEVQNRVIFTEQAYTDLELNHAANYINREFVGKSLVDIRKQVLQSMKDDQEQINQLMQVVLEVASKSFETDSELEHDYIVTGERNLFDKATTASEIQAILDAFQSKSSIVDLLDRCIESEGTQLFIGTETGYAQLGDYAVISTQYRVDGNIAGAIGVIGPTRMPYQKMIPLVEVTAMHLGKVLKQSQT